MVKYSVTFKNSLIQFYRDTQHKSGLDIAVSKLKNQSGKQSTDDADCIKTQLLLNYLDTRKDGCPKEILDRLDIYGINIGQYPKDLHDIEERFLTEEINSFVQKTWTKVAKSTPLDKPEIFEEVFWESGLGPDIYIKKSDESNNATTKKTIGSYLDPLEKSNQDSVWPSVDDEIELDAEFMELMGFKKSTVTSKTLNAENGFNYNLTINCGKSCNPSCTLSCDNTSDDDPNKKFFAGNKEKKDFLTDDKESDADKTKFIVFRKGKIKINEKKIKWKTFMINVLRLLKHSYVEIKREKFKKLFF